ncbi:hypothetical protein D3C73_1649040 [compost metagenome]
MLQHHRSYLLKDNIADPVPVLIIYFFEIVDIEHCQLHGKRIALLVIDQPAQILMKGLMVVQIG